MVVRTNLDERILTVRLNLDSTFDLVEKSIQQSIDDLSDISLRRSLKAVKRREKMRSRSQEISQDLLLILTLNSPMLQDLRIITAFLRTVDSLDRITTYQRQITSALQKWANLVDDDNDLPDEYISKASENFETVSEMGKLVRLGLITSEPMQIGNLANLWKKTLSSYEILQQLILEEDKSKVLGKQGRIHLTKVSKYIERTGYEYSRIISNWYFAIENEWIVLDDLDDLELTCESPFNESPIDR